LDKDSGETGSLLYMYAATFAAPTDLAAHMEVISAWSGHAALKPMVAKYAALHHNGGFVIANMGSKMV